MTALLAFAVGVLMWAVLSSIWPMPDVPAPWSVWLWLLRFSVGVVAGVVLTRRLLRR